MKLSPIAILFGAAVAFFPGASAATATTSLRGSTPDDESFTDIINKCSDLNYTNENKCLNYGCSWNTNNNTCNSGTGSNKIITRSCRNIFNGSNCIKSGCDWINGVCRNRSSTSSASSSNLNCSVYHGTRRSTCVIKGCYWDDITRTCNSSRASSSNLNCSVYHGTRRSTCVIKGCYWDDITRTCNSSRASSSNASRSSSSGNSSSRADSSSSANSSSRASSSSSAGSSSRVNSCTGPNDTENQCDFLTEFCYTKGNCSANARGECMVKPKTFADCANSGSLSISPTSAGNACDSNHYYNSECQAAISGKNIDNPMNKDVISDEFEHEEYEYNSEYKEEE